MFHTYFDDVWDMLHSGIPSNLKRSACSMPSFPHSNVWVSDDKNTLTMEFALAGYSEKDISVTAGNNSITVTADPSFREGAVSIHNGIARRRVDFTLAVDKTFDTRKAKTSFENGLLCLVMDRTKESKAVKLM